MWLWFLVVEGTGNLHMAADLAGLDHDLAISGPMESLPLPTIGIDLGGLVETGAALVGTAFGTFELKVDFGNQGGEFIHHNRLLHL